MPKNENLLPINYNQIKSFLVTQHFVLCVILVILFFCEFVYVYEYVCKR